MITDQMKAEGWIEHDGGPECPIAKAKRIECVTPEGILAGTAGRYRWSNIRYYREMRAYKPEGTSHD